MTAMTDNKLLADRARDLSRRCPPASLDRRAWLCCTVALGTTKTIAAARRALADISLPDVQTAALTALDQLTDNHAGSRPAAAPGKSSAPGSDPGAEKPRQPPRPAHQQESRNTQ